jgi:SNF2 family DNA or RNA helicase
MDIMNLMTHPRLTEKGFPMNEIAYLIHSAADFLVIQLAETTKEKFSYTLPQLRPHYSLAQWRQLATLPADKEAFALLCKENQSTTPSTFHILSHQTIPVLKLMGATQKLFYQEKQLVADFFGSAQFFYQAISLNTGELEFTGYLKWRETEVALAQCDLIGPGKPHWFIRGFQLKTIETFIPWKKLKEAYQQKTWQLTGLTKQAFIESIDPDDLDSPQLKLIGDHIPISITPYPLLILKDRSGAFADLWMVYDEVVRVPFHDLSVSLSMKRQVEAEKSWEKDLLETDFIKKEVGHSHYYCPLDKVGKSLTFLLEIGWTIRDWQNKQVKQLTELKIQIDDQKQQLVIQGQLHYDTHEANLEAVLGAFNRKERFIQLSENEIGLLPINHLQPILQDLADESEVIQGERRLSKSRFGALGELWDYVTPSAALKPFKEQWQNFQGIQEVLPGNQFQGTLRPYQQEGLNWLSFLHTYHFNGLLADEMGLGKTVQVLAFLSRLPQDFPHLIVMPTSLLFNWRCEIERFLPSYRCLVHQGVDRTKNKETFESYSIILTSYTTLRLDLSLFQTIDWQCIILDEAQIVKNAFTQTAQALYRLSSSYRLCLTGTPIENRLQELWSHYHFLMPELFGSLKDFESQIQAASADKRYLERIKRKINPFFLRRRKQEVAKDLPPRIDQIVWIEMGEEQQAIYHRMLQGYRSNLLNKVQKEGVSKHRMEVLEALLRLRQVCCHPLLVSSLVEETSSLESAKFDVLFEDLETIQQEGHKVLVYSQFTSMLHLMTKEAAKRQWNYTYLDGQTKNREERVTQFQNDPTLQFFFISLKAGGVGLNLTAADYVFIYDPWWNDAAEEQAIDRAHRIGRQTQVIAKRLVIIESIEEKIMKLKAAKRSLIDQLIDNEQLSQEFTMNDLLYLFTD